MLYVSLDVGGTFTDFVAFDDTTGKVIDAKAPTTPYDLAVGIRQALVKSGVNFADVEYFIHGSTIAINTALERTGACTALLVTDGMRDIYAIGRGNRPEAYNVLFRRPQPLVPRRRIREIPERLGPGGVVIVPLDIDEARTAVASLANDGVEAFAVCLLHSYANPDHEKIVGDLVREVHPDAYLSISHQVVREYREYERTATTVMNAYVGPRVSRYLQQLEEELQDLGFAGRLFIMQSNGGLMGPETAKALPVAMMESGPVGGIIAAARVGEALGYPNVIAFDMGGTTAKASLVRDAMPQVVEGYYVGGYAEGHPVTLPVVDVIEVGAGGGSIAAVDEVGSLRVGPRSAGGFPGPICYGWGGHEPTVTDAHAVLGRLNPTQFLGGEIPLQVADARAAIEERVATPLGLTWEEAATGILQVANNTMALAVRGVSVERGYDPRDFALVAFGGAGPLHAVEIARELGIPAVIVPRFPAHFSAIGMLLADLRHDYVQTIYRKLDDLDGDTAHDVLAAMRETASAVLESEGAVPSSVRHHCYFDMRYVGQEFYIMVELEWDQLRDGDWGPVRQHFAELHSQRYGHAAVDEPMEVVNLRLVSVGERSRPAFPQLDSASSDIEPTAYRQVFSTEARSWHAYPVFRRESLQPGHSISGPAIVEEYASTTVLHDGDRLTVAPTGELVISVAG